MGFPPKKSQTDDDVALHGLSLIGHTVENFPAQVNKKSHRIARVSAHRVRTLFQDFSRTFQGLRLIFQGL